VAVAVAKVSAAAAAAAAETAARLWDATANPDGRGLLLRGEEYLPRSPDDFDPLVLSAVLRLARLADAVAGDLRECPDARVRRSAAVLAARAHPLRAAFDE
jgi:hypothetical protein